MPAKTSRPYGHSHEEPTESKEGRVHAIGFWAGVCLLTNNITGPGMVSIPGMFQSSGWLIPTLVFIFAAVYAALACLMLSKALTLVPGNGRYKRTLEFSHLAEALFPKWLYMLTILTLIFTFQASNMSAIVESAQTMDSTLLATVKETCALVLRSPTSPTFSVRCLSANTLGERAITDSPFGEDLVISFGYIVVMLVTIPIGLYNLEDNMWVQVAGFLVLVGCMIAWTFQFLYSGLDPTRLAQPNGIKGLGNVLSTVIFNFGFVTTIPSWLNEKTEEVSVVKTVWVSVFISGTMFILLGVLGGLGFDYGGQDLLAALTSSNSPNILRCATLAAYLFPPAALLTGIPVFSIIIRYNLVENGICGHNLATVFGVLFPWVASLFFYSGNYLHELITWSSALFFVELNFTFPLLVYALGHPKWERKAECFTLTGPYQRMMDDAWEEEPPEEKEDIEVVPECVRSCRCCSFRLSDDRLAWILVGLSGPLALATLLLQAFS